MKKIEKLRDKIFKSGNIYLNIKQLSKDSGIPLTTLKRYRDNPEQIRLDNLLKILEARDLEIEIKGDLSYDELDDGRGIKKPT